MYDSKGLGSNKSLGTPILEYSKVYYYFSELVVHYALCTSDYIRILQQISLIF